MRKFVTVIYLLLAAYLALDFTGADMGALTFATVALLLAIAICVLHHMRSKIGSTEMNYFEDLEKQMPSLRVAAATSGPVGFFAQEVMRFYSVSGTLKDSFPLDETANFEQRCMTHVLFRSLLENYFRILYIFDVPSDIQVRYDAVVDNFRREYGKLLNEPLLPNKQQLEPAGAGWSQLPRGLDMSSMLAQLQNDYGDRLNYLYFTYRIASFDTHGNNLKAVADDAFGKPCNFPVLKLKFATELVANQYLVVLNDMRGRGEI